MSIHSTNRGELHSVLMSFETTVMATQGDSVHRAYAREETVDKIMNITTQKQKKPEETTRLDPYFKFKVGDTVQAKGNYWDEQLGEYAFLGEQTVQEVKDVDYSYGQEVKVSKEKDSWISSAWFELITRTKSQSPDREEDNT